MINKTLRLLTFLPVIPKYIPPTGPEVSITINSEVHLLPRDMFAFISTSATHRHPKYWPCLIPSEVTIASENCSKRPFAVADFDPERWMKVTASTFNKDGFLSKGHDPGRT